MARSSTWRENPRNVQRAHYYVDYDPDRAIGHYSSTRLLDVAGLRKRYEEARALPPATLVLSSPLAVNAPARSLPRFFACDYARVEQRDLAGQVERVTQISNPYRGDGSKTPASGEGRDFATTDVGDDSDTSPFTPPTPVIGISTEKYLANILAGGKADGLTGQRVNRPARTAAYVFVSDSGPLARWPVARPAEDVLYAL